MGDEMKLGDVLHQTSAVSLLRRALRSGRMPHAYLFDGPEGVGKERAALALAARLLCEAEQPAPDADACGECTACRLMAVGNHPDFHLVHRGLHKVHPERSVRVSKGLFLVVDLIRYFVIEPAARTPQLGRRRVFVIRDAERMNDEAQNALLKTLEEPPGEACLVLITSSASRLLPTIRSRCQRVPFGGLPRTFVEAELARQCRVDAASATALAALADGRLGAAIRWQQMGVLDALRDLAALVPQFESDAPDAAATRLVEIATALGQRASGDVAPDDDDEAAGEEADDADSPRSGRGSAKTIATDVLRDALKLILTLVSAIYRDALVAQSAAAELRNLAAFTRLTDRLAAEWPQERLDAAVRAAAEAESMLDRNVAAQLVCERLVLTISGRVAATA
ncbi:DNA polymerase III subunit delta' [Phycisphaerae bacterium RAS1]|nr:DNA polymerase III subunit delta' [Phycisphaerae bacterium RAS1]